MRESKKTPKLSVKPGVKTTPAAQEADAWVERRDVNDALGVADDANNDTKKRVTFEVTEKQHQEIKIRATKKGMTIKEYMIALVEKELST